MRYDEPMTRADKEIIDFIAKGATLSAVADFRPSQEARKRVADLIDREKNASLSHEESAELARYMQLEYLMRMAKARARQFLRRGPA